MERRLLEDILRDVHRCPTAGNLQAFRVVALVSPEQIAAAPLRQSFARKAGAVLIFVALRGVSEAKYGARGRELYALQDATIACITAMLAAEARGIASCWIGAFDPMAVSAFIGVDGKDAVPVAVLPLGYSAEAEPRKNCRKDFADMVVFN